MLANNSSLIKVNRWPVVIAIMAATLMQVLDMTIVNVALPYMQGSLNASSSQMSWILTSYLVASAIVMPLSGYFSDLLGRKNYLLWCIGGFTVASALCGIAGSINEIVIFRLLQGVFGAAIVPLSQSILIDIYPKKELGKAMALWGTGVMVGPVLGPTLGGYLTEVANWRFAFYINIPIGIMAFLLALNTLPNFSKKTRVFDWISFLLLALMIGSLQYLLDRGNNEDWFNAISIKVSAFISMSCFFGFLAYNYFRKKSIFDLSIFKDRNFSISSLLLLMSGVGLFGSMAIFPLFLENLLNYSAFTAGLMMTPRAISVMIAMIVVGRICHCFDLRKLILVGVSLSALGTYVCTYYSLDVNQSYLIWPAIIQGFGLGMIFVPISAIAFSSLPEELRSDAVGVFSLFRTIGGSIGIAVVFTVFTRNTQIAWNRLVGFINPYNTNLVRFFDQPNLSSANISLLASELAKQAMMLAIISVFIFITWSFLIMIPAVIMLKKVKHKNIDSGVGSHGSEV